MINKGSQDSRGKIYPRSKECWQVLHVVGEQVSYCTSLHCHRSPSSLLSLKDVSTKDVSPQELVHKATYFNFLNEVNLIWNCWSTQRVEISKAILQMFFIAKLHSRHAGMTGMSYVRPVLKDLNQILSTTSTRCSGNTKRGQKMTETFINLSYPLRTAFMTHQGILCLIVNTILIFEYVHIYLIYKSNIFCRIYSVLPVVKKKKK